ncbi:FixH family protein [Chryseosolibacter indicus]|uniref:FixH family protein n=1 Tax=Chryseosolibacter indicus TaxID=2782351 RepID=A0ABS5VRF6_9BACT|nr:FixH family protein [Chryseosolibacter indicus]MBT1703751.1 FixH family protein [Chryseosolibacter indicus]
MSIGKWIVVAFVLFAGFIATLVTVCMKEDISLVSKEYYKEELAYQSQIQRINNTAELKAKPVITASDSKLNIVFGDFKNIENGEVKLFCPSNDNMDRTFNIVTTENTIQTFDVSSLQKGMYKAKFKWRMNGKEFYQEEVIFI